MRPPPHTRCWTLRSALCPPTHLYAPPPTHQVLDLCAAPGGKTTLLAELMSNRGYILACDIKFPRLQRMESNLLKLLGPDNIVSVVQQDGRYLKVGLGGGGTFHTTHATHHPHHMSSCVYAFKYITHQ